MDFLPESYSEMLVIPTSDDFNTTLTLEVVDDDLVEGFEIITLQASYQAGLDRMLSNILAIAIEDNDGEC